MPALVAWLALCLALYWAQRLVADLGRWKMNEKTAAVHKEDLLRGVKLFETFGEDQIDALASVLEPQWYDEGGVIRHFRSALDILEVFYEIRKDFYAKRKAHKLADLQASCDAGGRRFKLTRRATTTAPARIRSLTPTAEVVFSCGRLSACGRVENRSSTRAAVEGEANSASASSAARAFAVYHAPRQAVHLRFVAMWYENSCKCLGAIAARLQSDCHHAHERGATGLTLHRYLGGHLIGLG